MVVVCDGSKGSHSGQTDAKSLRGVRRSEFESAAALLGVASVVGLDHPDGDVVNDTVLRGELVGLIRSLRPDVVVGHDPTATFFAGVYVNHHDHRETGWALLDAVAPAAAMPLYFPEYGVAHQVRHLLLSGTQEPDVVVDISRTIDRKAAAVLAHTSQLGGDAEEIREVVYGRAEQAGRPVGVAYGEAFRSVQLIS